MCLVTDCKLENVCQKWLIVLVKKTARGAKVQKRMPQAIVHTAVISPHLPRILVHIEVCHGIQNMWSLTFRLDVRGSIGH